MGHMIMKILFINANTEELGGADFCLLKLAHETKKAGNQVLVILRKSTPILKRYEQLNIPYCLLPIIRLRATDPLSTKLLYPLKFIKTIFFLFRIIRRFRADLVHTNDFIDGAGNLAAFLAGVPSVQSIRVIIHRPSFLSTILKILSRFSTYHICVSMAVMRAMFPDRSNHCQVIYDWLDLCVTSQDQKGPSLHAELNQPPEVIYIVSIGRIEPWKGQHLFLQAIERVAEQCQDVHFLLVGSASLRKAAYLKELQQWISQSTCRERISLLGFRLDIQNILRQSIVFVHSSVDPEPFGFTVTEAMACGTIVVAPNAGGIREQIRDNVDGFLYEPGDVASMAEKIIKALSYPARGQMRDSAKERASTMFAAEANFPKIRSLYESLISNRS